MGVAASQELAREDLPRLKPYAGLFVSLGGKYHLPPALLAAIASRESRGGSALSAEGWGDNHNGFGLMQVDKNSHPPQGGPYSLAHLEQATRILKASVDEVTRKHSGWAAEQQLRGGVAAYNVGVSNVRTIAGMDRGTTGDDYSGDVWARAQFLAPDFGGGKGAATTAALPPATGSAPPAAAASGGASSTGAKAKSLPVVKDLQLWLVRHGYMTEAEMKTGPGVLGPRTRAAVARFLEAHADAPGGDAAPAAPAEPVSGDGSQVLDEGFSLNTQDPILRKLATGKLSTGANHSCVRTTLNNMKRLEVGHIPAATGSDPNNSRGAMVQLLANGYWTSLPLAGSHARKIVSPYGTVSAYVIPTSTYAKVAKKGWIPSGAIIFQTKHGWDYGEGPYGNDMGIVRDGGRVTFNYASMPPIIYREHTKEVVLVVPRSALVRKARS
ncbi:hypothetical protein BON30_17890 [Cystobacter ferrugineus]|uniref:Lysozyme g n=2 Tax=Cystobacter ferrugineus TaxID=83449 RepID=A0A1L9BB10_9BACT|nr:hypothetical protein BON30_17890 [Cystobacter ferrugineus]